MKHFFPKILCFAGEVWGDWNDSQIRKISSRLTEKCWHPWVCSACQILLEWWHKLSWIWGFCALKFNPTFLPLRVQEFLKQFGTMWRSPPHWLRAGLPISLSGRAGPNRQVLRRAPIRSWAPTATWLKERKRLDLLQVFPPSVSASYCFLHLYYMEKVNFFISFLVWFMSVDAGMCLPLVQFKYIISWAAPTFCHAT